MKSAIEIAGQVRAAESYYKTVGDDYTARSCRAFIKVMKEIQMAAGIRTDNGKVKLRNEILRRADIAAANYEHAAEHSNGEAIFKGRMEAYLWVIGRLDYQLPYQ